MEFSHNLLLVLFGGIALEYIVYFIYLQRFTARIKHYSPDTYNVVMRWWVFKFFGKGLFSGYYVVRQLSDSPDEYLQNEGHKLKKAMLLDMSIAVVFIAIILLIAHSQA